MNYIQTAPLGLWELAVLSLLRERPMHPYEIQKTLKRRRKDDVLVLKRGSLYHAIGRLLAANLIEVVETRRDGARPERTTYRLLASGERALLEWLRRFIAEPQLERSHFLGSVSFLVHLTPEDALAGLRRRAELLRAEIEEIDRRIEEARPRVGRIHLIESEYARAMRVAEHTWVQGIVEELAAGSLHWDLELILQSIRGSAEPQPAEVQS